MTDYTEQDIDQMIDEILEQPETVTKTCRKCGAAFQADKGRRTLCPACFREARAANAKLGRAKLAREAQKKPGGVEQVPQGGAGIATAAESSREDGPSQLPAPTECSQEGATSSVACGRQLPLKGEAMGTAARESGALTVGKLLELLDHAPRDAVIREVTAVELRSIWEPSHGQRAELYFRRKGEE